MTEAAILKIFKDSEALLTGHFKLSSGLHSGQYLQAALVLQDPALAQNLCKELALRFKNDKIDVVIGPALGGIIVSYEVARALGCRSIFTEREDGRMALRRGFNIKKKETVLVVEDVVTTGGSTKEVIEVVKDAGGAVAGVGSIIDRSDEKTDFGLKFEALLKMKIETFKEGRCPLCRDGIPTTKPGSRRNTDTHG